MAFAPSGLWTPSQTLTVATNLSRGYQNAPSSAHTFGKQFYPEWNATAEHIGRHIGQDTAAGSALLAQLSPSNEAELNRIQGMGLVHGGMIEGTRKINAINRAAEHESAARSAGSTARQALKAGDTTRASRFMEEHGKHQGEVERLRKMSGIEGTPLAGQTSGFISKAVNIREGRVADPLGSLGDVKLGDFGRMIHDPEGYTRPPIDTHYHDAGIGRTDIPYDVSRGLGAKSRYEGFQGAHAAAHAMVAEELGVEPTHAAMMGAVWYGHQMNKAAANPNSAKARAASESKIGNIRRDSRFKAWMPESHGLAPSFAKVGT